MRFFKRITAYALSMLLIAFTPCVMATDSYISIDGFSFTINGSGESVIHEYDGRSKDVVIPNKLMGAVVTEIDDYAFFSQTELTSVSFENATGLKRIGTDAFYGCTGFKNITIPSFITELGFGAFQDCKGLETATIGSGVTTLSKQLFYGCTSLRRVILPDTMQSLDEMCLGNCDALAEVEIPDSVNAIADNFSIGSDKLVLFCNEGSYTDTYANSNELPVKYIREYVLGDANLDGRFNILDATTIQKYKIGQAEIPLFRGRNYADVNGDGTITVRDATLIQMKLAKLITDF